ncbi:MAG: nucleotidyl transferase AbiEii/AbiGii toxin family protein [Candidatus Dojkabacteria bacterium]
MHPETLAKFTQNALAELVGKDKARGILQEFYLAGGTAAALQLGHRISVDLDFFTTHEFDPQVLLQELNASGIKTDKVKIDKGTLKCVVAQTEVSFFFYPYQLIVNPEEYKGIKIASLIDIGCMKLTAIASRGSKKDFYDLYYILREKLDLEALFAQFEQKFAETNYDSYHFLKSLVYFVDADKDPKPKLLKDVTWEEVKTYIKQEAKEIVLT